MGLITIPQLLESVDLDFEPKFVTRNKDGLVVIWAAKPKILKATSSWENEFCEEANYSFLKLTEFDGKDWTECIYEVPLKLAGKIERLKSQLCGNTLVPPTASDMFWKINELVDAVNELQKN